MPKLADRVKESSTTTGTGAFTLAGAVAGYRAFSTAFSDADVVYYFIVNGTEWEVGYGAFTLAGTTLARTTVLASSNANALVNFSAGTKEVFCILPASLADVFSATGKTTPVDADLLGLLDSAASNVLKKLTWANLKATIIAALGTAATKNTGTSGDAVPLLNGANTWSGAQTLTGSSIIEAEGADVASAATTNIWATDGNTRHITGTTTITSFGTAPQAGAWQKVIFDGVLTLTHSANLNLPGAANITTAAGDFAFVYADTTTQFDVLYFRADGTAVVASGGLSSKQINSSRDNTLADGTQDITGFGFNPTAAIFFTTKNAAAELSFGSVSSSGSQAMIYLHGANNSWTYNDANAIASATDASNYNYGLVSFIADGIRITWTKVGAPTGTVQLKITGFK